MSITAVTVFELNAIIRGDSSQLNQDLEQAGQQIKKSGEQYKSDVAKRANELKRLGMESSEAWKQAYKDIDKNLYDFSQTAQQNSQKAQTSFGGVVDNIAQKFKSGFENIKNITASALSSVKDNFKSLATKAAETAKEVADKIANVAATVAKVSIAAVGAASAAVVGFGKKALDAGMSFDSAMSQVAATMGKTVADMESEVATVTLPSGEEFTGNLRDFAKKMGAETKYSATEAAGALNFMALAGYSVEESMQMMPNVLNLASAGAMNLQKASDMLTDTQTALGLSFERTNQLVDEMAKAASTGNTSVEQLGDAFLTVGGLAKEMNGGFVTLADGTQAEVDGVQELEIALTAMANAGVKGSKAGTHMRNMLLKLTSPTEAGTKAFEEMEISIFDTEDRMRSMRDIFGDLNYALSNMSQADKLAKISDIFNARDTASAEALLAAVEQDWDKIGESILDAEGAASAMSATQINNLSGAVTIFQAALEGVYIAISDKFMPALIDFVDLGQETLSDMIPAIESGDFDGVVKILENGFSQALDKVAVLVPKILTIAGNLVSALAKGIARSLPKLGTEIVKSIPKILGTIRKTLQGINGIGTEMFSSITDELKKSMPGITRLVGSIIKELAAFISKAIPEYMKFRTNIITEIAKTLTKPRNISIMIDAGISLITALADGLTDSIGIIIQAAPEIIANIKQSFIDNKDKIKDAAVELWNTFKDKFTSVFGGIDFDTIKSDVIDPLMAKLSKSSESIYDNVIKPAWDFVVANLPKLINSIADVVDFEKLSSAFSTATTDILDGITTTISETDWGKIASKISDFLNNIDWAGILKSVFDLMGELITSSEDIFKTFQDNLDQKYRVIAGIIGLNFARKFIKKISMAMGSDGEIMTSFNAIRKTMTTDLTLSARDGGLSFGSKFMAGLTAFFAGWELGTWIREDILGEENVDEAVNTFLDYLGFGNSQRTQELYQNAAIEYERMRKGLDYDNFAFYEYGLDAYGDGYDEDTLVDLGKELIRQKKGYAKGGVITKPTIAMVGEAGDEVVMPLENNTGWISELAQRINTEIAPTVSTNPIINFDKAAEYSVEVSGELKISNLEKTLENVEKSLSEINTIIIPEIKSDGIQGISEGLNGISDIEVKINGTFDEIDAPEIPDIFTKIKAVFEDFDTPEIPENRFKIIPEFEMPEINSLRYTAENMAENGEETQSVVIENLILNMDNKISTDYDVDRIPERIIRKLSDRIDTYKYRNRRGVGGTA